MPNKKIVFLWKQIAKCFPKRGGIKQRLNKNTEKQQVFIVLF